MPSAPYDLSISAAQADALFASPLQRSDEPSARQVRQAIATALAAYGVRGCAARVAQDYGEHPETALTRMRWALTAAVSASGGSQAEAGPRPRTWPLHRALHRPCRVSHPPGGFHGAGPAHGDRPQDRVRTRPRCTPPSGHITGVTAACVHRPDRWTEHRNPTT
jgi:hypothetical protein